MTTATAEVVITQLDPGGLIPSPHNPRRKAPAEGLKELAASLSAQGVLEPLLVRPMGKGHEILAGHRRAQAAVIAKLATVPCIVRDVDDKTAIEITVTENMQREQLSPLEEAAGLESLSKAGWNAETMAAELGKSATWVARRMSLLGLAPDMRKALADGKPYKFKGQYRNTEVPLDRWPARSLEILASVPPEAQVALLEELGWNADTDAPLPAALNEALADTMHVLSAASFDKADATLNPKQGACTACDLRSSCRKSLFDEQQEEAPAGKIPRNDRCLNPVCFGVKLTEHAKRQLADAKAKHGAGNVVAVCSDHRQRDRFKDLGETPWNAQKAKAGDKGAKFYFDVAKGKGEWRAVGGRSSGASTSGKKAKPATVPMKERKAQLEKRRLAIVLRKLQDTLDAPNFAGHNLLAHRTEDLVSMAARFGTNHKRDGHHEYQHKSNPWRQDDKGAAVKLAESIAEVLAERARVAVDWKRDAADMLLEAKGICETYDLDFSALKAAADAEVPEPKSWAKLNADGSAKLTTGGSPKAVKPERAKYNPDKILAAQKAKPASKKRSPHLAGPREQARLQKEAQETADATGLNVTQSSFTGGSATASPKAKAGGK